jgi:hypothetical protein
MDQKPRKTREAKPGELREIRILELLERLSKRPESRLDVQRLIEKLSPATSVYLKHLITSGPSSVKAAAKACEMKADEIEAALTELEQGIAKLRA